MATSKMGLCLLVLVGSAMTLYAEERLPGSWVREDGPMRLSVRFTDDHLSGVFDFAIEEVGTIRVSLEGDYAVNRESTAFGVVTGIDIQFPKNLPDFDPKVLIAAKAQFRGLIDGPFRFTYRIDGETLTIKRLRAGLGEMKIPEEGRKQLRTLLEGMYQRTESIGEFKPTEKWKAKTTWVGGMDLPSSRYLERPPQYLTPPPAEEFRIPSESEFPREQEHATSELATSPALKENVTDQSGEDSSDMDPDLEKFTAEMIEVLDSTESRDVYIESVMILKKSNVPGKRVVPALLRNGERLGFFGDFFLTTRTKDKGAKSPESCAEWKNEVRKELWEEIEELVGN